MRLMPRGLRFNAERFSRKFVSGGAALWLGDFFGKLPEEKLVWAITHDKDLTSYFPQGAIAQSTMAQLALRHFSDEEIYSWLPEETRRIIEAQPKGQEWAIRQVSLLKTLASP